jgi:hypothetical protein
MSKVGLHEPFGHLEHKLWPKEKPKVKLIIWLSTTKSWGDSLVCRWCVTYHWKALDEGYNFDSNLISIKGLHRKLCAPKVTWISTLGILGLPLENLRTKCHLDADHVGMHRVYYKGEGDGFPQVRVVVNFVNPSCPRFVLAPKMFQLGINQLVFGFVHVRVNSWCLSFFLVSS